MKLWKVQKIFGDLIYDLRSRRLLPIAGLLVVAMIGVPILVGRGSSSTPAPSLQANHGPAEAAPEVQSAVASYSPAGLRNYKQRLDELSAKNPFSQPAGAVQAPAQASQLSSTVPASPASSTGSASPVGSVSSGGSGTGTATTGHRFFLFHAVADVSFGEVGQPLVRHKQLKNYAFLPDQTLPVLVYVGSTLDQKRALFAVSKYTDQLTGDGACSPGPTDCTLLAVAPGESEDMVYAGDGKTYRVKLNKITLKRRDLGGG